MMRIDRKKAVSLIRGRFDESDGSMMLAARCMCRIPSESDDFSFDLGMAMAETMGEGAARKLCRHYGGGRKGEALRRFRDEMFAIVMESEVK